jgi:hypothetical protein
MFSWGVNTGYDFQVGQNSSIGVEFGYKNLGDADYAIDGDWEKGHKIGAKTWDYFDLSREINQQAIDLLVTYHYYIYKGFNVFAKAGVADVYSMTTQHMEYASETSPDHIINGNFYALPNFSGSESIWRFKPEVQIGAGYLFDNHVSFSVAFDHIGDGSRKAVPMSPVLTPQVYGYNAIWANLAYNF